MRLSHLLIGLALLWSTTVALAGDEATQGSFHGEITDGSELIKYKNFINSLESLQTWAALGATREGGKLDSYKGFFYASSIYKTLVEENGGAVFPDYSSDKLNLKSLSNYRQFVSDARANVKFVPDDTTCGAAVTYAYPAMFASHLYGQRAAYVSGKPMTAAQISQYNITAPKELKSDFEGLKFLCDNYSDKRVVSGIETLYNNAIVEIPRAYPAVDHEYDVKTYPYVATISCGMSDGNINVRACFKDSDLIIDDVDGKQIYKIYNMDSAGAIDRAGLHVKLSEHFKLAAQNSHHLLILSLVVADRTGKVVYSDKQGQYGVINVAN